MSDCRQFSCCQVIKLTQDQDQDQDQDLNLTQDLNQDQQQGPDVVLLFVFRLKARMAGATPS